MQLSPHFSLKEFTRSATAVRLGIDNSLPDNLLPAAKETALMMENIRARLTRLKRKTVPITITSGYRCPALNAAVGSGPQSHHLGAFAVDWEAPTFGTPTEICEVLQDEIDGLGIGQLINEYPDRDGWVHTSRKKPSSRVNRIITITRSGIFFGITS